MAKELKTTAKLLSNAPNNPYLRGSLCKKRKEYKRLIKKKKREWKSDIVKKLEEIEDKDPKEYWRLINELRENKRDSTDFDAEKFTSFFEKLYSAPKNINGQSRITDFVLETLKNISDTSLEPKTTTRYFIKLILKAKNLDF